MKKYIGPPNDFMDEKYNRRKKVYTITSRFGNENDEYDVTHGICTDYNHAVELAEEIYAEYEIKNDGLYPFLNISINTYALIGKKDGLWPVESVWYKSLKNSMLEGRGDE